MPELEDLEEMGALLEHAEEMQRSFTVIVSELRYLYEAKCAYAGFTPIKDDRQGALH